jgi:hypothetical protein
MEKNIVILALAMLGMSEFALAQQISDFKSATQAALRYGESRAVLNDDVAAKLREQMRRPNAKVLLHVTTLSALPQPGCKRLQLHFTSPGSALELVGGGTKDLDVVYGINMCEGGMPPAQSTSASSAQTVQQKENRKP